MPLRLLSLLLAAVLPLAAQTVTLSYLGNRTIATGTLVGGTEFGGISGISYNPYTDRFIAVTDDSRTEGASRLWTINLTYDGTSFTAASAESGLQLRTTAGAPLPRVDTEGIAGNLDGSFLVSHEGLGDGTDTANSIPPWIRRFSSVTGNQTGEIPLPDKFIPRDSNGQLVAPDDAAQVSGVRSNFGIENLGISPSRRTLFAANEAALKQDDSRIFDNQFSQAQNSDIRIVRYTGLPANPVASGEKVYQADQGAFLVLFNTVPEILPLDDNGRLLVLERGPTQGNLNTGSYRIRIYEVDYNQAGATDVSAVSSLIGASFTRLTKSLRWESSTNMDNVEAMCWGRDVNGFRTLVLASDNNFSATQITQFHVFLTNIPAVPQRTLTTTAIGSGSITATPQLPWYPDGSDVALTAVPGTHHDFYRWEGDASGNANPLTLAMSANRSVSARFRSPYEQWKFLWFTEEEIFNSQITEPGQDPDADARDNLLEYAFGTVPTTADTGGFTAEALSPGHVLWNGSFETTTPSNPLPAGTQVFFDNASYVLSDWTEYNGANTTAGYLYHRNPTQWTAGYGSTDKTPFGNNVLGLGRGGASSVIQNLGQVSAGESYSLSGLIGRPTDSGTNPTGGYQMQLYLGATPGALTTPILTLNNATLTDPALGTWSGFSGTTPGITSAQDGQYLTAFIYAATGTWPSVREFDSLAVKQEGGLVAEFTLVESAADLSYIVQTSTDLVTWTDGAVYVPTGTGYTRTPGSGTYAVEAIDNGASRTITEAAFAAPDPATRQFIRIKLLK